MPAGVKDIRHKKFGYLTPLEYVKPARWRCICVCGNYCIVYTGHLKDGHTKSCGCLVSPVERATTHGLSKTVEYRSWAGMISRCCNTKSPDYHDYGGRGIMVSPLWRRDFQRFLSDVGVRPTIKHSLDRYPNNNGHYEPGNVRWALPKEQSRNTRRNRYFEVNGKRMVLQDWAEQCGFSNGSPIFNRVARGWPLELALTTPKGTRLKAGKFSFKDYAMLHTLKESEA